MRAINGDKLVAGSQGAIYAGISSLGARILEVVLKGIRISCHGEYLVGVTRPIPTIYPIGSEIPGGPRTLPIEKTQEYPISGRNGSSNILCKGLPSAFARGI